MNKRKNVVKFLTPGIITAIIMLVAYICKGIVPFGSMRVDYFDNMQQVAPLYAHLWDAMHGQASIFYDWYTGLGTSVTMSISAFSMFSPFNALFFIIPREYILESIAYLNIIKSACAGITMYLCLRYVFPSLKDRMNLLFSVMFSLCGFAAMYAPVFTPWMDIVAIMPLTIWAMFRVLRTGEKPFLIIMIATMFIINYYLAAMIMIYCLLMSGLYIIFMSPKSMKLRNTWDLIISGATGIGLSAFILVPVYFNLDSSQRNAEAASLLSEYKDIVFTTILQESELSTLQRFLMFFGCIFAVSIVAVGVIRSWKNKDKDWPFYTSLTVIALLPVLIQGANLVWHLGSYYGYALRMGFLVAFGVLFIAARYSSGKDTLVEVDESKFKKKTVSGEVIAAWIAGVGVCAAYVLIYPYIPKHSTTLAFYIFAMAVAGLLVFYIINIGHSNFEKNKAKNVTFVFPLVFAELFISVYSFIGVPKFFQPEQFQYGGYVQISQAVGEELWVDESETDRIKNPDLSLNANYPLTMRRASLSSFTAAVLDGSQRATSAFGYSQYFLWMLDAGGTAFSDALLHETQAVSIATQDKELYRSVVIKNGFKLYDAKYTLPFGNKISDAEYNNLLNELDSIECFDRDNERTDENGEKLSANDTSLMTGYEYSVSDEWIPAQNAFYHALSGSSDNIITKSTITDLTQIDRRNFATVSFNVDIPDDGKQTVYMSVKDALEPFEDVTASSFNKAVKIYVNGKKLTTSVIGDALNTEGINDFNNALMNLGTYEGGNINVKLVFCNSKAYKNMDISVGSMSINKLNNICKEQNAGNDIEYTNDNNSLTLRTTAENDGERLVIPMIYSPDTTVYVNGEEVEKESSDAGGSDAGSSDAGSLAGLFTQVRLKKGENEIVIRYSPRGLKLGIAITLAILAMFIIIWAITKGKSINVKKWLLRIATVVFFAAFAGLIIAMILIPFVATIPATIQWILL